MVWRWTRTAVVGGVLAASALSLADDSWAKFASGSGNVAFLAAGALLPLARDGSLGREHTLRALDTLAVSVAFSEGLKHLTRVKRPDSDARDSFPSGHATAAFAIAAVESSFHPSEAPLWYAGAAAIADSRIELHRHRWSDVLAGAAIGVGVARWEVSEPKGLLIQPYLDDHRRLGVAVQGRL